MTETRDIVERLEALAGWLRTGMVPGSFGTHTMGDFADDCTEAARRLRTQEGERVEGWVTDEESIPTSSGEVSARLFWTKHSNPKGRRAILIFPEEPAR